MNNWIERVVPVKSFFRVDEVAGLVGVHENTVRRWIDEGKLECMRLPVGSIRIPREAILKLLAAYAPDGRRTRGIIHPGISLTRFRQ